MSVDNKLYKVLLAPRLSEKSTIIADKHNQYTFKVAPDASKIDVRRAVEMIFKVDVESVSILNRKGKVKRTAHGYGKRESIRKAYVRIAQGQQIDFAEME